VLIPASNEDKSIRDTLETLLMPLGISKGMTFFEKGH